VPAQNRSHYQGSYQVRAQAVRDAAYSDPSCRCWRCGLTLAEKRKSVPDEGWDAGHVIDGQYLSPLVPEHSSCNRSAGAKAGNKKRSLNASRRWF
jgi:hypothetical protein